MLKAASTLTDHLFGFARRRANAPLIERLHGEIVAAARQPALFRDHGVPDTVEGRFEMLALHGGLLLMVLEKRAAAGEPRARDLAKDLSEALFLHLDRGLRESGVGDLAVPKRIKKMAEGFYGRLTRYEDALERADRAALAAALDRNIFAGEGRADELDRLAHYVERVHAGLSAAAFDDFVKGPAPFPAA